MLAGQISSFGISRRRRATAYLGLTLSADGGDLPGQPLARLDVDLDQPGRGVFPEPLAAKVPEITFLFWVVKILTTCGGEAVSDYLALGSRHLGAMV